MENYLQNCLKSFLAKFPKEKIVRFICYYYLSMLYCSSRKSLELRFIYFATDATREFTKIVEDSEEDENRADLMQEGYKVIQNAIALSSLEKEEIEKLKTFCEEMLKPAADSLEYCLKDKLSAVDIQIISLKSDDFELGNYFMAVSTLLHGVYKESFALRAEKKIDEEEVNQIIKAFYEQRGYIFKEKRFQDMTFEDHRDIMFVNISIDDNEIRVTVD